MFRKVQFALVGLTGVAVSFASLWLFIEVLHWNHSLAYALQTVLAIEVNFLLNDAFTWRDRHEGTTWGQRALRFHATRVGLMIPINQVVFGILQPPLGTFKANLVCIAATTIANWFLNDKVVFKAHVPTPDGPLSGAAAPPPVDPDVAVSIIVPVRNSGATIRACVDSLLAQDTQDLEILIVGDSDDTSWPVLADIVDPRLRCVGLDIHRDGAVRDANLKRSWGMYLARGRVIALTDSDMTLHPTWVTQGLNELQNVAVAGGGMISGTDGFIARYVDKNLIASRTPRSTKDYLLTRTTYGRRGMKPPITASLFLRRSVYRTVGGPDPLFTRSFEDYEWARRIVDSRFQILMTSRLDGWHAHRTNFAAIMRDYFRSGRGCSDYLRAFPHCRFARNRRHQVAGLFLGAAAGLGALATYPIMTCGVGTILTLSVCGTSALRSRSVEAALYPFLTLLLGLNYWRGLVTGLLPSGRSLARPTVTTWTVLDQITHLQQLPRQATGEPRAKAIA